MRRLDILRETSADLGFVRTISPASAGYPCPDHDVDLVEHRLETISGWHAVTACPAFDGTCSFDPDGEPEQIEAPDDETPAAARTAEPSNSGGF